MQNTESVQRRSIAENAADAMIAVGVVVITMAVLCRVVAMLRY